MLMLTVFDILTSENSFDYSIEPVIRSIKKHLQELLNTRKGSLVHLPDYGISDLCLIYQGLPHSAAHFCQEVKALIEKYELRLTHVRVSWREANAEAVLTLEIEARLVNGFTANFMTSFQPDYAAIVMTR